MFFNKVLLLVVLHEFKNLVNIEELIQAQLFLQSCLLKLV